MIAKNVTESDLQSALDQVNKKYADNIKFKRLDYQGRNIRFTLTVNSSKNPGGRLGFPDNDGKQKHLAAACWHAHGDFFDALFSINPSAVIVANGSIITSNGGNWQDRNIGSQYRPLYYSEACECGL
jgi:hypothetical protein